LIITGFGGVVPLLIVDAGQLVNEVVADDVELGCGDPVALLASASSFERIFGPHHLLSRRNELVARRFSRRRSRYTNRRRLCRRGT
jgi:hypothetical protein